MLEVRGELVAERRRHQIHEGLGPLAFVVEVLVTEHVRERVRLGELEGLGDRGTLAVVMDAS